MMTEQNLIVNIEKTVTGEKVRTVTLTSAEAVWSLRYIFLSILRFEPEQVEYFLDRPFLETYGMMRFVRMVDFPVSDTAMKKQYLLSSMFPELYKVKVPKNPLERYLYTLGHTKAKEVWQADQNLEEANTAVQWVLQVLFRDNSCKAVMQFAAEHPKDLLDLMRAMRLGSFYDALYSDQTNGILDLVFFSYPLVIQRACFLDYVKYRLPETDDVEFEILTEAEESLMDRKRR